MSFKTVSPRSPNDLVDNPIDSNDVHLSNSNDIDVHLGDSNDVDFNDPKNYVEQGDSVISSTLVRTSYLGPCLALLLNFVHKDQEKSLLAHYDFSVEEIETDPVACLDQILSYLLGELNTHSLKKTNEEKIDILDCSNINLVVAGGASKTSKFIHESLSILNQKSNDSIERIDADKQICFLYEALRNNVLVFRCVSKILSAVDSDEDDDEGIRKQKESFQKNNKFLFFD